MVMGVREGKEAVWLSSAQQLLRSRQLSRHKSYQWGTRILPQLKLQVAGCAAASSYLDLGRRWLPAFPRAAVVMWLHPIQPSWIIGST